MVQIYFGLRGVLHFAKQHSTFPAVPNRRTTRGSDVSRISSQIDIYIYIIFQYLVRNKILEYLLICFSIIIIL